MVACTKKPTETDQKDSNQVDSNIDNSNDAEPNSDKSSDETASDPIEITYPTYRVGAHVTAEAEKDILDEFNRLYGDKVKVVIEELPSDEAYAEKMKVLAASSDLPDIVEGKGGIIDLAIKNGQAVELTPYLDEDQEFKEIVGENAIEANLRDGKLYSIANARQLIGYFYNKEMFDEVEIAPAKTWEEFMSNCEALKEGGFVPVALMTGENAWTTNLIVSAMIGTDGEEGNSFMNTMYPESYNNPEVVDAFDMIKKMLNDYTSEDAIGALYANAANNFLQEKAAIIANGPWMTPDFADAEKSTEGFANKVGVALYPEDGVISQYEIGYMVCTQDSTKIDAAIDFLKFKTGDYAQKVMLEKGGALPLTGKVEMSDEFKAENPLIVDLINLSDNAKYEFLDFDNTAYPSVQSQFAKYYPELAFGNITAEEMAEKLTEAVEKSK